MGIFKKTGCILMSACLAFSVSGCSNSAWSVKDDLTTVSIGSYIYYMSNFYMEAKDKVTSNKNFMKQKIDDKTVSDYIKDNALDSCKQLVAINKKMSELGISLTDDEINEIKQSSESQWKKYSKVYEQFGVSEDSFYEAGALQYYKYSKLFDALYNKDGEQAVSDDEIKDYYLNNYIDYIYLESPFTSVDESGNSILLSDEEIAESKARIDSYVEKLNNGASYNDIIASYIQDTNLEEDPSVYGPSTYDTMEVSDEVKDALKNLENNKAVAIEAGNSYYLIYKGDINNKLELINSENGRYSVLSTMKSKDYEDLLTEIANNDNIKVNSFTINRYNPNMFEKLGK